MSKRLLEGDLLVADKALRTPKSGPGVGRRISLGGAIFDSLNVLFFVVCTITFLYPFWYTVIVSFSDIDASNSLGLHIWLQRWDVTAYRYIIQDPLTPRAYFNTIARAVVGTSLTILVTIMFAYPLSKKNLPGRNVFTVYLLITMFFSGGLIPTYLLIRRLGLIDNRWVLILPALVSGMNVIIVRNFFMTIDSAYEESAFIDGANYVQVLFRVIMPLSGAVLAVITLWSAVGHWNAWFDWLVYMRSNSKIVLQMLIRKLLAQEREALKNILEFSPDQDSPLPSQAVKAATTIATIGPIILMYPFLQRYFVKGIFIGSLKG